MGEANFDSESNWAKESNWVGTYALVVKSCTPNDGAFAELGRFPLLIMRKIQIITFANRLWSLDDKKLVVKEAMTVQILDDVKCPFYWVSEVITIMRENNINRSDISKTWFPFNRNAIAKSYDSSMF